MSLEVHAFTHVGRVHHRNEDSHSVVDMPDGGLVLMICDGMGGMGRGDQASRLAVDSLTEQMTSSTGFPPDRMAAALQATDVRIRDELCTVEDGQAGSTAVLVYVLEDLAHIAWVGDSRIYWIHDGNILERTRDHKLVEDLIDAGELTPEEARQSSLSSIITRALGGRLPGPPTVEPALLDHPWKLQDGDTILMCSDGLSDLVLDQEIPHFLDEYDNHEAVRALVRTALARGGHDNITVLLARYHASSTENQFHPAPVDEPLEFEPEPAAPPASPSVRSSGPDADSNTSERRIVLVALAAALVLLGLILAGAAIVFSELGGGGGDAPGVEAPE